MTTKAEMRLLRQAIAACRDDNGRINPDAIIARAKNPKTKGDRLLHSKFEWDVDAAAHNDWRATATRLIREVKLHIIHEDRKIIAPFYVRDLSSDISSYIETTKVARSEELSEATLLDELARIEGAIKRARAVAAVFDLSDKFERMLDNVVEIRKSIRRGRGDDDSLSPVI